MGVAERGFGQRLRQLHSGGQCGHMLQGEEEGVLNGMKICLLHAAAHLCFFFLFCLPNIRRGRGRPGNEVTLPGMYN